MCYVMRLDKTKENYDCLYLRVHVDHNRLLYMCNRVETIPVHTLRTWLVYTNYQLDLFSTFTVMKERLKNEAICERILAYQYKINLERLTSMKETSFCLVIPNLTSVHLSATMWMSALTLVM